MIRKQDAGYYMGTSTKEIEKFLGGYGIMCVRASQLDRFKNIDDLFKYKSNKINSAIVILYNSDINDMGHFVAVIKKDKDTIEYFDSFGYGIDEIGTIINRNEENKQPFLSNLLNRSVGLHKYDNIYYNSQKLQDTSTAVCAKWCIARIQGRTTDLDEWLKIFTHNKVLTPDEIVNNLIRIDRFLK